MFVTALTAELQNGAFLHRHFQTAYDSALKAISLIFVNSFLKRMFPTKVTSVKKNDSADSTGSHGKYMKY
jgi:hypothetical protein